MNQFDEDAFVKQVCRHLDASVAHLPTSTLRSLDASRQAALMQKEQDSALDSSALAAAVSRELDEGAVPAEIEAKLNQIRQSAVAKYEKIQREKAKPSWRVWLRMQFDAFNFAPSAGMLATSFVLVTAISLFYINARPTSTLTLEEEIGLVATAEDIELYDNLEFYLWLAENESLTL